MATKNTNSPSMKLMLDFALDELEAEVDTLLGDNETITDRSLPLLGGVIRGISFPDLLNAVLFRSKDARFRLALGDKILQLEGYALLTKIYADLAMALERDAAHQSIRYLMRHYELRLRIERFCQQHPEHAPLQAVLLQEIEFADQKIQELHREVVSNFREAVRSTRIMAQEKGW